LHQNRLFLKGLLRISVPKFAYPSRASNLKLYSVVNPSPIRRAIFLVKKVQHNKFFKSSVVEFHMQTASLFANPRPTSSNDGLHAEALLNTAITQVGLLTEAAAKVLGLNDEDAISVRETGLIEVDNHTVSIIPVATCSDGILSILLSVETGCSIKKFGSEGVAAVLQHASGALASFNATINSSAAGYWMLHRSVMVDPGRAQSLAEEIVCSTRLADFVLSSTDAVEKIND
jgi:hypothetical protein